MQTCNYMKDLSCWRFHGQDIAFAFSLRSACSSWKEIVRGVPQGSIMGPILFNISINDFMNINTSCDIYNYADDNTIPAQNCDIKTG